MKNLEQIRARNALQAMGEGFKGQHAGDALTGFPALIVNNGLLAAIAFSLKNGGGHENICNAIARHLADPEVGLAKLGNNKKAGDLVSFLVNSDSQVLRLCTAEALAFLNYLRRFEKAKK